MTKTKLLLPVLAALVLAVSAAATYGAQTSNETTLEDVKRELSEDIDAIKSYSVDQRDDALRQAQTMMETLDARIERQEENLRQQWHQMNDAAREEARATLANLKQKRNELAEWYGGLRHSSGDAWEEIKTGFSNAYSDLGAAWEGAYRQFESKD